MKHPSRRVLRGPRLVLAFVVSLASLAALWPASASALDGKAAFLRWANEVARGRKLSVCRAGQLRYPGEQPGYFAAIGEPQQGLEPKFNQTILFSNGKQHWSYADRGLTVDIGCDVPAAWETLETLNIHGQDMATNYLWQNEDVTFVDGEPVKVHEESSDVDGSLEIDWRQAFDHRVDWDRSDPSGPSGESQRGYLVALPPGSRWLKSWKAATYVSFGQKNWQGPADADLQAHALDLGDAGVRIVVDVVDDRVVPTLANADARRLVRSDHLELWWVPRGASQAKQLGIGLPADGSADVRWLIPATSAEKVPEVRRTGRHVEIDLSWATLGIDVRKLKISYRDFPFTVAFSDSDTPDGKQETVVATSPVRWNQPETFGQLIRIPGRFPAFGDPM